MIMIVLCFACRHRRRSYRWALVELRRVRFSPISTVASSTLIGKLKFNGKTATTTTADKQQK